jgi:hypothetical protein
MGAILVGSEPAAFGAYLAERRPIIARIVR